MNTVFDLPSPKLEYDFPDHLKNLFLFKTIKKPSEWALENFKLGRGYGEQGLLTFEGREWQKEIVDAYAIYKKVIVCGPVQVGKSIAGVDIPWCWWNANVGGHSLIAYDDKDKAENIFEERIKENIKSNLREFWSGKDDDLKRDKITLRNGIARCASANVENDFSSFSADIVFLDEVAKFKSHFDVVGMAEGRQANYKGLPGYHAIMGICSSPKKVGDPLYKEIHKGGVLILRRQMQCPHCKSFHELTDENIKELPNESGEMDHNPVRIRLKNDSRYECPRCHQIILDSDRWEMGKTGVWAAVGEEISIDGRIKNENSLRGKTDTVCFWPNRLVAKPDQWRFSDCLSSFFSARQSPDPKAWEVYQNEHMARFINPVTRQLSHSFLYSRVSAGENQYYQYSEKAFIPDGVVILLAGIDTQDDGFYFAVRGFGKNMESWLIRHGFIACDMNNSLFRDPNEVVSAVRIGVLRPGYYRKDRTEMAPVFGLMDEGGHRRADVHYVCRHLPFLKPYKGSSSMSAEPIKRSKTDLHYMGNTRHWSELVANYMESDTWHLPLDVGKDYLEQVIKQYNEEDTDSHGNKINRWVSGGNDHYRDTENLILAAAFLMSLPEKLNDDSMAEKIKQAANTKAKQNAMIQDQINNPKPNPQTAPAKERENYRNHRRNTNPYRRRF
jgi:phage terminase large subunit GpA-like protein